jgi:hypothetical protein
LALFLALFGTFWHFSWRQNFYAYFFCFFWLAYLNLLLDTMVQIQWARKYLDADGKCNILVNGIACGQLMQSKSSTVKRHVKSQHPSIFQEVVGHVSDANSSNYDAVLTDLACYFATTSAPISHLNQPSFKVYFQLVISKTVTLEDLESNSCL